MAVVKFNPACGIQSISGTLNGVTFRTLRSGRTVAHLKDSYDPGELRERPEYVTSPQRAKYVIQQCTFRIQAGSSDVITAVERRRAIENQVKRIYRRVNLVMFPNDNELIEQILIAYRNANTRHRLPSRSKSTSTELALDR